jgi:hypothetical protein
MVNDRKIKWKKFMNKIELLFLSIIIICYTTTVDADVNQCLINYNIRTELIIIEIYPLSDPNTVQDDLQTFNVTLNKIADIKWYINGSLVGTDTNITSAYSNSSANVGIYNITVMVSDEVDTLTETWFWTVKSNCSDNWDVNKDGIIDIRDIVIIGQQFDTSTTAPYPRYDVNSDGIIDIRDIVIVGQHFGQSTCWIQQ